MTVTDRKRLQIVREVLDRRIVQKRAAKILGVSVRQVKRLARAVRKRGDAGIIHGNRNRASNRRINGAIKKKVIELAGRKYKGFGPTLLSECLHSNEGLKLSDETLRLWLKSEQLPYAGRRARAHR